MGAPRPVILEHSMKSKKHLGKNNISIIQKTSVALFVFVMSFWWGFVSFETPEPEMSEQKITQDTTIPKSFPVGVNPETKEIVENSDVELFYNTYVSNGNFKLSSRKNWFKRTVDKIAIMPWYQNLASLSSRTLVIYAGERKEEVAYNFSKVLRWDNSQKREFLKLIEGNIPEMSEGKFYPGRYVVVKEANPEDVALLVSGRFTTEILSRYDDSIESTVPFQDAMALASLLEREAYDFEDMRYISGVIWNRMFVDMKLQIDATLQYARASAWGGKWWPVPRPSDKNISSPFNTYIHEGLPPHPISNPSVEAVLAALNPKETDCMYYLHDSDAVFHCSSTYEEHKELIEKHY